MRKEPGGLLVPSKGMYIGEEKQKRVCVDLCVWSGLLGLSWVVDFLTVECLGLQSMQPIELAGQVGYREFFEREKSRPEEMGVGCLKED